MKAKIFQYLIVYVGVFLILIGLPGIFLGVVEIFDPLGMKTPHDPNAFGAPASSSDKLNVISVFACISLAGACLTIASGQIVSFFAKKIERNNRIKLK